MIQTLKGRDVLSPTPKLRRTCRYIRHADSRGKSSQKRRRVDLSPAPEPSAFSETGRQANPATKTQLTKIAGDGFISSTTPSTPLHDAHQEGYSFIEVAFSVLYSDGIENPLDRSTLSGVVYVYQHLPHLSTMCTTGGFFLPTCQEVPR
jgi:hypothetical protein